LKKLHANAWGFALSFVYLQSPVAGVLFNLNPIKMFAEKIKEAKELLANDSKLDKVEIRFKVPEGVYGYLNRNYVLWVKQHHYYPDQFDYTLFEGGLFGGLVGNVTPMKNGKGMGVKRFWLGKVMSQTMHYNYFEFEKMVQIPKEQEHPEPVKETEELPF